jgi:hypothetical protein
VRIPGEGKAMSFCNFEECLGQDIYECLAVLQGVAPEKYSNLLADVMRIRCTCCPYCEDIEVICDDD